MSQADLLGQRFGRLIPTERRRERGVTSWLCRCACGGKVWVRHSNLKSGNTSSCGCLQKDKPNHTKHGLSKKSGAYISWKQMRQRCTNPRVKGYAHYGGRGITVCAEWADFEQFLRDMGERPVGMTLERKDVNGPYAAWNCCWATPAEQAKNRRASHRVTLNGKTQCLSDWARELGVPVWKVLYRHRKGYSVEEALYAGRFKTNKLKEAA